MKVSVAANEPNILREARPGDLFLVHTVELTECVCARALCGDKWLEELVGEEDLELDDEIIVVVIACRVGSDSPLYFPSGHVLILSPDTPITLLDQVERLALRQRGYADPSTQTQPLGAQAPPNPDPVSRL